MDAPFIYDCYVTGKNFIGRKSECTALANLIAAGENIVIYEPPKTGKKSVIQQTLFNMRLSGQQFNVSDFNMFNIRTIHDFLTGFGNAVIRSTSSSPAEYADIIGRHLSGTHFVFDRKRFSESDEVVSLNWAPDIYDIEMMLRLPGSIAEEKGIRMIMIIEEFQNILGDDGGDDVIKAMEAVLRETKNGGGCTFILSGSRTNAMKYIFEEKKYFHRLVEHLPLQPIDDRDIVEHISRGFLSQGKVVEKDQAMGACKLFRNNIWYINHFTAICNSLSKGYINEGIMLDALNAMLSIHEPRFQAMTDSLTDHQLSLLKAALDGVVRFSSTDVIEKYALNSSANVRRVKDALKKKEIITFNEKDEPVVLDPLFEYWVRKYYFKIS
ncbi:MAG: hypothetical protein OSJ55_00225 [Bacteroidales bacterium]|nr:hypothetical protein [Bacteroidales bacterium]